MNFPGSSHNITIRFVTVIALAVVLWTETRIEKDSCQFGPSIYCFIKLNSEETYTSLSVTFTHVNSNDNEKYQCWWYNFRAALYWSAIELLHELKTHRLIIVSLWTEIIEINFWTSNEIMKPKTDYQFLLSFWIMIIDLFRANKKICLPVSKFMRRCYDDTVIEIIFYNWLSWLSTYAPHIG